MITLSCLQVPDQDAPDMERTHDYNFDLAVLGGGSGGLACAKEAAKHGAKVSGGLACAKEAAKHGAKVSGGLACAKEAAKHGAKVC